MVMALRTNSSKFGNETINVATAASGADKRMSVNRVVPFKNSPKDTRFVELPGRRRLVATTARETIDLKVPSRRPRTMDTRRGVFRNRT